MRAEPGCISDFSTTLWQFRNRSICQQAKQESKAFLLNFQKKGVRGPRHPDSDLAVQVDIRLFPSAINFTSSSETQTIVRLSPPDCTMVAEEDLICDPEIPGSDNALEAPVPTRSPQAGSSTTPKARFFQLSVWLVRARNKRAALTEQKTCNQKDLL